MENIMEVSKKLKIDLPYDPAIPLLRIYPKRIKTLIWKKFQISQVEGLRIVHYGGSVWAAPEKCEQAKIDWLNQYLQSSNPVTSIVLGTWEFINEQKEDPGT